MENRGICRGEAMGQAVVWSKDNSILGRVRRLLLDDKGLKVVGLVVERFRGEDRVLLLEAVNSWEGRTIAVESPAQLISKNSDLRCLHALRHPLPLLGARVFTVDGRVIGQAEDYTFSVLDGSIISLSIRGKDKSLVQAPAGDIVAVSPHTVLLKAEARITAFANPALVEPIPCPPAEPGRQ